MPPLSNPLAVRLISSTFLKSRAMNDLAASLEHTGSHVLRRSARLSVSNKAAAVASFEQELSVELSPPASRKRKHSTKVVSQEQTPEVPTPKPFVESKKRTHKEPKIKKVDEDEFVADTSPSKRRKTRERKPSPIYIIPNIETKETSFKGRLGTS